ncbi:GNAT family N-acetyltransferase [Tardiphaga robiniae]|uniref:GCN5 family acetyltransferase n=1 Tax=Tardiphaga robiniae TaxID=943830 RepID=A0A161RP03_9BRAD|nr:N-acetyltransferase [Tardiphaga robiniae]KZD25088.1 GCN5 family acetyltransferase [Tardiphaga robiniae]
MTDLHETATNNTVAMSIAAPSYEIRAERGSDVAARESLLDVCFGASRHARTCQRLRDGRLPAEGLAFSAVVQGRLVGTIRLWHVDAGGRAALMLGPLAVDPGARDLGLGAALMNHAIAEASARGHGAIVLLGDAPYYARFGFTADRMATLALPGPFERDRLLGLELKPGALDRARGIVLASGKRVRRGAAEFQPLADVA